MTGLSSQLPWGWFIGLAAVDVGLAGLALRRYRRHLHVRPAAAVDALVRCSGWIVPHSAARALAGRSTTEWGWQIHRETLGRTLYNLGA